MRFQVNPPNTTKVCSCSLAAEVSKASVSDEVGARVVATVKLLTGQSVAVSVDAAADVHVQTGTRPADRQCMFVAGEEDGPKNSHKVQRCKSRG